MIVNNISMRNIFTVFSREIQQVLSGLEISHLLSSALDQKYMMNYSIHILHMKTGFSTILIIPIFS